MGRKPFVRDKILDAAFDLFARRGYEAVSTREIADAAGVGPASMYRHFASKEELGRVLYEKALAPLQADMERLLATEPKADALVAGAVRLLYEWYDRRPRACALLVFPPHDFTPHELDRANPQAIRQRLQHALALDDDVAAILWGAMTGPVIDRFLHRRSGVMAPLADTHAGVVARLLTQAQTKKQS